jgi:hypothetical protein
MKTTRLILLIIFPSLLLSMKCVKHKGDTADCHYRMRLNNNSNTSVYAGISYDYPDTSLNFQRRNYNGLDGYTSAHSSTYFPESEANCLESGFRYSGQKMSIFLFDAALIEDTPWSVVRQNYMVYKRLDFTLDELRSMDFIIDVE